MGPGPGPEPGPGSGACDREDLRVALGALALGALDAAEARQVRRHLADCPECQAEYTSFVGVKRVMDAGLVGAAVPEVTKVARPGRQSLRIPLARRIAVATASCVAALGLVFGGFFAGRGSSSTFGTPGSASGPGTALPAVTQSGVTAKISYQGQAWGTWVEARTSGAPNGVTCTLYVYAKNHAAIPLSSWTSVAGRTIEVPATTSLTPDQIDHFEVRVAADGYDISVPMN